MYTRKFMSVAIMSLLIAAVGCGKKEAPAETPAATAEAPAVDASKAATITGKVKFEGTAPKMDALKMNADPFCLTQHREPVLDNSVVVNNGMLENVFVHVKEGLGNRTFPTPKDPVVIDQQGCMYHPHVFGMMAGQPLKILNSDATLHNIHAMSTTNTQFNIGQPVKGMETTKTFDKLEMVPFKCDVHSWMHAYVGVVDNPYFAVSGKDGAFTITMLPPGQYVIEAWHEKFGAQTENVSVGEKEMKDIAFTFKAS